jgi:hypothetical protein
MVARRVAEAVVDLLEVVEVGDADGDRPAVAGRPRHLVGGQAHEMVPVEQAGEPVGGGQALQAQAHLVVLAQGGMEADDGVLDGADLGHRPGRKGRHRPAGGRGPTAPAGSAAAGGSDSAARPAGRPP